MYLVSLCLAALSAQLAFAGPGTNTSNAPDAFKKIQDKYTQTVLSSLNGTQCTKNNIAVRRSWEDTPISQRQSYISAVKCLHSLPSKSDPALVPGARNRLDDFTYAHINQTNFIHESGWFLPWHRVFVHSYEIALQTECNYNGTQPYWDWASFSDDQTKSALFDGSDTSIGGNGEAVAHPNQTGIIPGLPTPIPVTRPAGTGGGCVTDGPFAQPTFTVNIGPVSPIVPGYMSQPSSNDTYGTQYNPRCLKRDFLPSLSAGNLSWANVTDLMETPDIHSFRPTLEGSMHPSAHSSIGADLFDLFSSPSDPAFFFLHSQIDRLWTVWQGQDPATRTNGLDGTTTFVNDPPSANATLDDTLVLGLAGGYPKVRTAMSATQGQFCYMYA